MNTTSRNICIALSAALAITAGAASAASDTDDAATAADAMPTTVEDCLVEVAKMKADGVENADEFEATCIETVETMKMEGAADVEIQPVPKESN